MKVRISGQIPLESLCSNFATPAVGIVGAQKKKPPNLTSTRTCVCVSIHPMVSELPVLFRDFGNPDYSPPVSKISVTLLFIEDSL